MFYIGPTGIESLHLLHIRIKAENLKALLGKTQHQGQSHITQTDNTDAASL